MNLINILIYKNKFIIMYKFIMYVVVWVIVFVFLIRLEVFGG